MTFTPLDLTQDAIRRHKNKFGKDATVKVLLTFQARCLNEVRHESRIHLADALNAEIDAWNARGEVEYTSWQIEPRDAYLPSSHFHRTPAQ